MSFLFKLFGTLAIDNGLQFYVYLKQTKNKAVWVLLDTNDEQVVSAISINKVSSSEEGYGDVIYLHRMLELYMQAVAKSNKVIDEASPNKRLFVDSGNCKLDAVYNDQFLDYIVMSYEGFNLVMNQKTLKFPALPDLSPIVNEKSEAAIVANLGVRTAAEAKMKFNLDWYKDKKYYSVKTDEEFLGMIEKYCKFVVECEAKGEQALTGVDTETTGLFTVKLSKDNPAKDWIVAIPFSWQDNEAYLIYVRMAYFSNVSDDLINTYFNLLFSRNKDFTGQQIKVAINGNTYSFNRDSICTTGHNTMFDGQTFYSEEMDFFFDEDSLQLAFNLATDWSKGKSSLKALTRRLFGHETLELEDLFGSKHKDKFAYLQDEELARIYGCADADYARLVQKKLKSLTEPSLYYQYKKYDICLMHLYAIAAAKGMPIDTDSVKRLGALVKQDIETIQDFVYKYAYQAINKRSNESIVDIVGKFYHEHDTLNLKEMLEVADDFDKEGRYCFKFTPAELKTLVFGILKYPVIKVSENSGEPALDKYVLQRLTSYKLSNPVDALRSDICSTRTDAKGNKEVLISAKDFNSDQYPLARVLSKYAELNKEYTSYYAPIMENNLEGRMFASFSTTTAATRRIINPLQTAKSELKKYYIAPKGMLFGSFDVSQMEYRLMGSISYIILKQVLQEKYPDSWEQQLAKAPITLIKRKMSSPETDYHIETASTLHSIKPHLVDKKLRKVTKTLGFGIPYGLGKTSLCSSLYGEVTQENMKKTQDLLDLYYERQIDIIRTLNSARTEAFIPATISDDFREYLDIGDTNVGIVRNFAGFYRMFILRDLTKKVSASIRRKAGNFLIQGGAAELFRRMLYRFYMGCLEAGIEDKVHWLLTVHDELDFIVDEDIDICKLIEVLYKSCTLVYRDHIPYFIGINFGKNWYEAKSDAAELPVFMVQRLIKKYNEGTLYIKGDGNQPEVLMKMKHKYFADRIYEEIVRVYPDFRKTYTLDLSVFDDVFTNYTVRSYIFEFMPSEYKAAYSSLTHYLTFWGKERLSESEFNRLCFKTAGENHVMAKDLYDSIVVDKSEAALEVELDSIILSDDFMLDDFEDVDNNDGVYFGEEAFLSADADEDNQSAFSITYNYMDDSRFDDEFVEDFSSKSAHGILKLNKYVRQYVNTIGDSQYSILTSTTKFASNPVELLNYIKAMPKGNGTIHVVWRKLVTINNIDTSQESLDTLDKFIGGNES